jgi:hypothetical protein
MKRIVFVACSATKLTQAAPAKDLYTSDLFKKSRAYAEALIAAGEADAWAILSAKHGIVAPDTVIEPYDQKLTDAGHHARAMWDLLVLDQLDDLAPTHLIALAGRAYRTPLNVYRLGGHKMTTPMEGLGIGQQKAWLKAAIVGKAVAL